ncbi:hypothetical protein D3C75_1019750 [compost metagenome]
MKTGDLLFAAIAQAEGLQGPGAYGVNRTENIALTEQELTLFQGTTALDDVVECVHILQVQRQWQAQRRQAAILAMGLCMGAQLNWLGHFFNPCGKNTHRM